MKKLVFSLLFLVSCSNLSKNTIESGKFYVRNGVQAERSWNEDLIFDRFSWYHELSLQFEIMLGNISPQSGFNFWFSKDELDFMSKCTHPQLMLAYSIDTSIIPYSTLNDQLEKNGITKIELIEFKKNLNAHPDSSGNSLKHYRVFGLCRKNGNLNPIKITFPGFSEKALN